MQISPEDFEKPSIQAIEDNINAKYADRVIQRVGLCIGLYDILSSTDGLIGHGTGIVNVNGLSVFTVYHALGLMVAKSLFVLSHSGLSKARSSKAVSRTPRRRASR